MVAEIIIGALVVPIQSLILGYLIKTERRVTAVEIKLDLILQGGDGFGKKEAIKKMG